MYKRQGLIHINTCRVCYRTVLAYCPHILSQTGPHQQIVEYAESSNTDIGCLLYTSIAGLILGYFADGIYQLIFLFVFGGVIAMNNPTLMIATGVGVKNTIDLKDTVKYALDTIPMLTVLELSLIHIW